MFIVFILPPPIILGRRDELLCAVMIQIYAKYSVKQNFTQIIVNVRQFY